MKKINIPKQDLIDYYVIMGLSSRQIAEIYNCCQYTILYKMKEFNIPRRPSGTQQGFKHSEETKRKISEALKDKPKSEEHIRKMRGKNNHQWKGDKVKIGALHRRIKRNKIEPECCEICNKKGKLELSNKDHKYSLNIEDYQYLCSKCHFKYDLDNNLRIKIGVMNN